jgi:hypothetical protein
MKKRVRIYKAGGEQGMVTNPLSKWMMQMGGVPQAQPSDEQLFTFVMNGLSEEVAPEDLYQQLVSQNIDPAKADQIVSVAVERLEEEQNLNESIQTEDPNSAEMLEAENLKQQEAAEEMARRQRMQSLYTDDYDTGEQEFMNMEDQMLMQTGGVPSKKAFVKNVMNLVKKEKGGMTKADSTDDGSRENLNNAFVNSLRSTAEEARIKKEAESLYDTTFLPEAQRGREMRKADRQQRRLYKNVNKMLGQIPMGYFNRNMQGVPSVMNFMNMPNMMPFASQMMPMSSPGNIRMANIDVRRTGLFGRPKEYSITFGQDVLEQPQLREDYIKQEIRNVEEANKEVSNVSENKKDDSLTKNQNLETSSKPENSETSNNNVNTENKSTIVSNEEALNQSSKSSNKANNNKQNQTPGFTYYDKGLRQNDRTGVMQVYLEDEKKWVNTEMIPSSVASSDEEEVFNFYNLPETGLEKISKNWKNLQEYVNSNFQGSNPIEASQNLIRSVKAKQEGGFVNPFDEDYGDPNLYKFIHGGNDFEEGGSLQQYQTQGQVNDTTRVELIDKKTNKVVGYTTMKEAENNPKYAGFAHKIAAQTSNNTSTTTNQQTQNQTQQYYDNFMNPYGGYGRIYPPLFGARRFTPYPSPAIQYAGSWTQQKGLPYDPRTGKPYTSSGYGQLPLSRIDVKGRKSTYTFGEPAKPGQPSTYNKDGYSGVILPNATNQQNLEQENIPQTRERVKGQALWRYPKIGEYTPTNMETAIRMETRNPFIDFKPNVTAELQTPNNVMYGSNDANIWYANQNQDARQEFDLRNRQYGGIPYAQSGMEQDEVIRMNTIKPQDILQPSVTSETQDVLNPFAGEQYAVDTKRKDMYTIDFPQMVNKFNAGAYKALDFFGGLGDYGNQLQQYANLTSDNVYTPTYDQDKGNYDPTGLFRPGRTGQLQYSQMGGNIDDEVEMTEEEIEAFLANGGQLEYL